MYRERLLGSVAFLELRDVVQQLSLESVVSIAGTLVLRAEQAKSPRLESGELEVRVSLNAMLASQRRRDALSGVSRTGFAG